MAGKADGKTDEKLERVLGALEKEGGRMAGKAGGVSAERVVREMASIAFSSFFDFAEVLEDSAGGADARREIRLIPSERIPPRKRAALASLKQSSGGVEIKLYDKWRALESLARILGLYEGLDKEGNPGEAVKIIDDL